MQNNINSLLPQTSTTTSSHKENASKAPSTGDRRVQMHDHATQSLV